MLIKYILDIDAWGFSYRVSNVANMANVLIDEDTHMLTVTMWVKIRPLGLFVTL